MVHSVKIYTTNHPYYHHLVPTIKPTINIKLKHKQTNSKLKSSKVYELCSEGRTTLVPNTTTIQIYTIHPRVKRKWK